MFAKARALHYVLKIGSLKDSIRFFRDKLCMTVLRHEVFGEGCKASCNGPYDGQWTKTMIGYGPESGDEVSHFVLELTYNYAVKSYALGNDLQHIKLALKKDLYEKIVANEKDAQFDEYRSLILKSPDGYKFLISQLDQEEKGHQNKSKQDIVEVCLSVKSLEESLKYWRDLLQMKQLDDNVSDKTFARLSYDSQTQAAVCLKEIGSSVDRAEAFGRTAFSIPSAELRPLEKMLSDNGHKILVPYVSLDTPGKATVEVVIVCDPNGHEICFVCEEGFRKLSQPDEKIENLYF